MMTTPAFKQYQAHKRIVGPDTVLLFQMGDFFETFGRDATVLHEVCGVTITRRMGDNMVLAGFPCHTKDAYIKQLVQAGHKVAISEIMNTTESPTRRCVERVSDGASLTAGQSDEQTLAEIRHRFGNDGLVRITGPLHTCIWHVVRLRGACRAPSRVHIENMHLCPEHAMEYLGLRRVPRFQEK